MILIKVLRNLIKEDSQIDCCRGVRVMPPIEIVGEAVILLADMLVDFFDLTDRDW